MSEITRKAVELDAALNFKAPRIKIYVAPMQFGNEWRCDIDHGPGHHGVGNTPAEALINAAIAWRHSGEPHD